MRVGESRADSIELSWRFVNEELCAALYRAGEGQPLRDCLKAALADPIAKALPLDDDIAEDQIDIVIDMLFHGALFCLEEGLDDKKTSTVLGILWEVHRESMVERYSMKEALQTLEHWIIQHSVHRPPQTVLLFNLAEVKAIHHFCVSTYFRHYKLYEYAFTPAQVLTLHSCRAKLVVPMPAPFPALQLATREEPPEEEGGEEGTETDAAPSRNSRSASRVEGTSPRKQSRVSVQEQPAAAAGTPSDAAEGKPSPPGEDPAQSLAAAATPIAADAVKGLKQPRGLKKQLETISNETATLTASKLDVLEARVEELEARQEAARNAKGKKK
eukprot:TRINITY_DN24012_c0_g1_i1.p1 TRINITY_DN24012_c0_g1~~TRINITY_DN24012_c0_g1_i1.p1  ORF type:complete len:329 (+),score=105.32 TRINITY_DN24012_c0_g1_i1:57-1043(+)